MSKIIRDIVHDYIHLNAIEEAIISTPVFLRLLNIHQSATAYLTYPSLRVNRFVHSLGCMELAGKIIKSCLENSSDGTCKLFLEECKKNNINSESELIHLVRLLGLLHDIGHLPFSHLSEGVFETMMIDDLYGHEEGWHEFKGIYRTGQRPKIHEFATYKLIETDPDLSAIFKSYDEEKYQALLLTVLKPKRTGIFKTIYEVVSSEIDADRGDYLVRDGLSSGIGFGRYDMSRLIESMVLHKLDDETFVIRPTTAALSTVETFLLERYKLYKWLYHHQYVVLTDTLLAKLLRDLLNPTKVKDSAFAGIFTPEEFHYRNYYRKDGYFFDEIEVWARLRTCFSIGTKHVKEHGDKTDAFTRWVLLVLRILLYREKLAKALWKNYAIYKDFSRRLHLSIIEKSGKDPDDFHESIDILQRYARKMAASPLDFLMDDRPVKRLEQNGFHILEAERTDFKPIRMRYQDLLVSEYELISKDSLVPITTLSTLVKSLNDAWAKDIQYYVYLIEETVLTREQLTDKIEGCKSSLIEAIYDLYAKGRII